MMNRRIHILLIAGIFLYIGCSDIFISKKEKHNLEFIAALDSIISNIGENAVWSVSIEDVDSGGIIFRKNPSRNLIPASNVKLFTTSAALKYLGPDFRIKTLIVADSLPDSSGIIPGNIYIVGGGDPSFSSTFGNIDPSDIFSGWITELADAGIYGVTGYLIGVDTLFHNPSSIESSWEWGDLQYYFAAPCGALTYNDNCLNLELGALQPGTQIYMDWSPPLTSLTVHQNIVVTDTIELPNIDIDWLYEDSTLVLTGSFPAMDLKHYDIPVNNPARFFMESMGMAFDDEGFRHSGYILYDSEYPPDDSEVQKDTLLIHLSPPLSEIVERINQESVNLYAEQLLRILGRELHGKGSPRSGLQAVDSLLSEASINPGAVHFVDGSGLSRHNWVSASVITELLKYCYDSDFSEEFLNSLPYYGTGTLKNRSAPVENAKVLAKTGSMTGVRARSGYIFYEGRTYVFSFICNNFTCSPSDVENTFDAIIEILCNFGINHIVGSPVKSVYAA